MTLEPLLQAPALIQLHAAAALTAVLIGTVQLIAPKGTIPHRAVGWTWVGLMSLMLISAFVNHDVLVAGPFSPRVCCRLGLECARGKLTCASIHMLSVGTFLALPYAVLHARHNNINYHRTSMSILFLVVLALGTVLTAIPHRIMHSVVFGPQAALHD
jgi:uncharacterized membrane protein